MEAFLNKLSVKGKINIITFFVLISLGILTVVVYDRLESLKKNYEDTNMITKLSSVILKSSEQGLQVSNALRGIIVNPSDTKAKDNFIKAVSDLDGLINELKNSSQISQGYSKFDIENLYSQQQAILKSLVTKVQKDELLTKEDNSASTSKWRPLKAGLGKWEDANLKQVEEFNNQFKEIVASTIIFIVSLIVASIFVIVIIIQLIGANISSTLKAFKEGLNGFFSFINRETSHATHIELNSTDEFGQMANEINNAIDRTVREIEQDNALVAEIDDIIEKVDNGFYFYTVKGTSSNPMTNSIKDKVNQLVAGTNQQMQLIVDTLVRYGESDFNYTYDPKVNENMNGSFGSLVASTMLIGNNVSELIGMILNAGEKLNLDTSILEETSNSLARASNEQAASLEETAAALEQITSTIINNNENINKILLNSKDLNN
ncbi:MAG: hypothetical protein WCS26_08585, partial [Arcobacteraceae bacterium]